MSNLKCPHCHEHIDLDESFAAQFKEKHKAEFDAEYQEKNRQEVEIQASKIAEEKFKKKQLELEQENEAIREKQRLEIEKEANRNAELARADAAAKAKQNAELHKSLIALTEKMNASDMETKKKELEHRRELAEARSSAESEALAKQAHANDVRVRELLDTIAQMKQNASETQKKADQGLNRNQGEAQELTIEEFLTRHCPSDDIQPIKTGARGADILQRVRDPQGNEAGSILYESKNTKAWSEAWVTKLRDDMKREKAHLGVLITKAMPASQSSVFEMRGVWVCPAHLYPQIISLLRSKLLKIAYQKRVQHNVVDKSTALYRYVTSEEFKSLIQTTMETFDGLQNQLQKERKQMQLSWGKREAQLNRMVELVAGAYGKVQGLGGAEILDLDAALPEQSTQESELKLL